jgi:DNA replication protein DnaC
VLHETVDCEECGGSGWLSLEDGRARRCRCLEARIRNQRLSKLDAEIPERYRKCSIESWQGTWPIAEVETWNPTKGQDPWALVLYGPPGTGKTHSATAAYRYLMARYENLLGVWLSTDEAIERTKGEFGGKSVTKETLLSCDLLLLDDVGRAQGTPYVLELIRSVLYQRHLHQLPTILTSNATKLSDFDAIDPALSDRLREGTIRKNFKSRGNWRLGPGAKPIEGE